MWSLLLYGELQDVIQHIAEQLADHHVDDGQFSCFDDNARVDRLPDQDQVFANEASVAFRAWQGTNHKEDRGERKEGGDLGFC